MLRRKPQTVRDVLEQLGMPADTIDEAELAGTAELLAIDAVVLPKPAKPTIDELAAKVGTDVDVVRVFWRALGFVDAVEDERSFSKRDVAMLEVARRADERGLVDHDLALPVARVVGLSMAHVATAVVDASELRSVERREVAAEGDSDAAAVMTPHRSRSGRPSCSRSCPR